MSQTPDTESCSCNSTTVVRIHGKGSYCGDDQHERVAGAIHDAYEKGIGWPGVAVTGPEEWGKEATAALDALRTEPAPATVDGTALREQALLSVAKAWGYDSWAEVEAVDATKGAISDVSAVVDAVMAVVAPVLAAKDERIAVLQRSWNKARDANTAWLDGGVVALPTDAVGQIAARVHDVMCDCHGNRTGITLRTMDLDKIRAGIRPMIESWRPATEPAEATVQQQLAVTLPDMLAEFHAGFGQSFGDGGSGSNELRARLHEEENAELIEALKGGVQVEIAHELADVVYVAYGTAHSLGIPLDAVIAEVHRANMSKTDGNGRFVLRDDGKVLKTDRYRAPDVAGVLRRAMEPAPTTQPYESCVLDGAGHCSRGSHTHDGGVTDE